MNNVTAALMQYENQQKCIYDNHVYNLTQYIKSIIDPRKIIKKSVKVALKGKREFVLCDMPIHKRNWYGKTIWNAIPDYIICRTLKEIVNKYTNLADFQIEYKSVFAYWSLSNVRSIPMYKDVIHVRF